MNRHEKYFWWGWGGGGIMRFWFRGADGNALAVCCRVVCSGYADRGNQTLQRNLLNLQVPFKEISSNDYMVSAPSLYSFFIITPSPQWARPPLFLRFLDHTQQRTTFGRTPLYEWSARSRDPYLTIHNTHNRQTPMYPMGFEPSIPAIKRPQNHALYRGATGISDYDLQYLQLLCETEISPNICCNVTYMFIPWYVFRLNLAF
jgi:hypothetical protein